MRKELLKLTKERLVDALLELAGGNDHACDVVERLISTPNQNLSRFEEKLDDLKTQNRFYDWRHASSFGHELRYMLQDLKSAKPTPEEAVRQIVAFYESDEAIFNSVDDSGGEIGPVHTQKPSQAAIGTRYRPRQYDCHDSSAGREYLGSEFSYLLLGREPSIPW